MKGMVVRIAKDVNVSLGFRRMVLLDSKTGHVFGLDAVGVRVWELINEGTCVEQIVSHVATEYSADVERVRGDVHRLIDHLVTEHLVTYEGGGQ